MQYVPVHENPSPDKLHLIGREFGGFSQVLGPMKNLKAPTNARRVVPCWIYRGPYTGFYARSRREGSDYSFDLDYSRTRNPVEYKDYMTEKWKPRDATQIQVFEEVDSIVSALLQYPLNEWLPDLMLWEHKVLKERIADIEWLTILKAHAAPTHPYHELYKTLRRYIVAYKPGQPVPEIKKTVRNFKSQGTVETKQEIVDRIKNLELPVTIQGYPLGFVFNVENAPVALAKDIMFEGRIFYQGEAYNFDPNQVIATFEPGGYLKADFEIKFDVDARVAKAEAYFINLEHQIRHLMNPYGSSLLNGLANMRRRGLGSSRRGRYEALERMDIRHLQHDVFVAQNTISSPLEEFAVMIYIYGQLTVPKAAYDQGTSYILNWIRQNPKRLLSLWEARNIMFGRMNDRVKFAKSFVSTSSIDKALQVVFPRIEGVNRLKPLFATQSDQFGTPLRPHPVGAYLLRYAFNDFKSWPQLVSKFMATDRTGEPPSNQLVLARMTRIARYFKEEGYSQQEFQEILRAFTQEQLWSIQDVLHTIQRSLTGFAETVEGGRYIQMYDNARGYGKLTDEERMERSRSAVSITSKLRELLRHHDRIMEMAEGMPPSGKTAEQAEAHHAGALQFKLIPGVQPLIKQTDFRAEKEAMEHCVYRFFWKFSSWVFSFRGSNGCKATLELSDKGEIIQFQSHRNTPPDAECNGLLREFLSLNADTIQKLKKPVRKGKEQIAQQNPFAGVRFNGLS